MAQTVTSDRTTKRKFSTGARWGIAAGAVLILVIAALAIGANGVSGWARDRIKKTLEETFASRLELKTLDVKIGRAHV